MQRVEFVGKTPQEAKRRALNHWYSNHRATGLSLAQFFGLCRVTHASEQVVITFHPQVGPAQRTAA